MDNYLRLLKIYNAATKSNCQDIHDPGFTTWLLDYCACMRDYIGFLEFNGVDFRNPELAELEKGAIDSILVKESNPMIKDHLISQYASPLGIPVRKIYYKNGIVVVDEFGLTYTPSDISIYMSENSEFERIRTMLTRMHNDGNSIIYGAFGNNFDKDKIQRIETVKAIYDNIDDFDIELNYEESNGTYMYYLRSKNPKKVLKKTLSKTR